MGNKKITFVTALYDIGRADLSGGFARTFEHYKECFSKMLAIDYPMVIYCESTLNDFIWKYRKPANTVIINKTMDDLRSFPFYDKIQTIRKMPSWIAQSPWIEQSPQAKLELYDVITMSKQFMLNDASLFNHFDTKYYLWLDSGISNTIGNPTVYFDDTFQSRIIPYLNKMLYIAFPYDGQVEVHGFEKAAINRYAGADVKYVCRGGLFGGSKENINAINEIYYGLLHDTLSNNYLGTEESIFTIIAHKYPKKVNVKFIESNGLIYKFLEDLKNQPIKTVPEHKLAIYSLTYNTPKQFEIWIKSFIKAYPDDFKNRKKYVIDNSNDEKAKIAYRKLFKEYNFEIIHEGENIGIQDGRQFASEHFLNKTNHEYMIFFEEDMNLVSADDPKQNKDGFIRYVPNLFESMMDIMEENDLDYLRSTIIEFYGKCDQNWAFKNVPEDKKKLYFPERKDGNEELRWKSKVEYLGIYKNVSYAIGQFHYSNWPLMFNRRGTKQLFVTDKYEHLYEQVMCSLAQNYMFEGKLKVGCLLAAPIEHSRIYFYKGSTRRENRHYTN